ncbi:proteinrelated to apopolysialoglycoprotein [Purpureocillium lavendulum]|uniref:Proteinrelated to apopolysialoglycoprotein n=1 Tax=Purpureocillium lavendulum TaxID=1247861 RepID=A0AB34G640_9HYPO|nr:proteinrelated to apopolysialoglycoprotein [Purpureocillium lavendulum]
MASELPDPGTGQPLHRHVKQDTEVIPLGLDNGTLEKIIDVHYNGFKWIRLGSWTNITSNTQYYHCDYWKESRLYSDQANAIPSNILAIPSNSHEKRVKDDLWNILDALGDLEIPLSDKTENALAVSITTRDISSTALKRKTMVDVPAHSQLHLYQRRLYFTAVARFRYIAASSVVDQSSAIHWTSGLPVRVRATVHFDTIDLLTTNAPLNLEDSVTEKFELERLSVEDDPILLFNNCSAACKQYIRNRGYGLPETSWLL